VLVLVRHLVLVQQRASMLAVEELQQALHLLLPNIVFTNYANNLSD
jgi:hypothetical protein